MKTILLNLLSTNSAPSAASMIRRIIAGFVVVTALLLSNTVNAQNGLYTCGYADGYTYTSDELDDFTTTKKNGVTPFPSGIQNQKTQYLYKANELTQTPNLAQGGGTITSIAFYVTDLPTVNGVPDAPYTLKGYTVKIGHSTDANLNSSSFGTTSFASTYAGAVTNYIGDLTISEEGWNTIELTTPFVWNGSHGIIVEICKSNTTAQLDSSRSNMEVRSTYFSTRLVRGYHTTNSYSSSGTSGCSFTSSTLANGSSTNTSDAKHRPDIRFRFACNGNPAGGEAVTAGTSTGVTGCSEVTLGVANGAQNSGLTFIWEKADNIDMLNAEVIAQGPQQTTVKVTQSAVDMYYRRKSGCGGYYQNSTPKKVAAAAVNTYNGGSWSAGTPNMSTQHRLVINDNLVVSSDVRSCGCEVKAGKNVTVESGVTLHVDSNLKVENNATLTFEDGATLLQKSASAVNTGNIIYRRTSEPLLRYDFTYWSSPVQNQTLVGFSPETLFDKYYSFNPMTQGWVVENKTNPMIVGKGYIIRAPQPFSTTTAAEFTGVFTGKPNNGNVMVDVSTGTDKFNLVGNPYPSAVDATAFYNHNASKLDGTFYFWSHHTPMTNANYSATDYAVWNQMGSVSGSPSGSTQVSNGYIAAGQSFMVKGKTGTPVAANTVEFTNEMRKGGGLNSVFFRAAPGTIATDSNTEISEKHRVWLNLTNAQAYKQVLVGYAEGATNGYDSGFDGTAMPGAKLSFYSLQDASQLAIQAKGLPFNAADQIALGFSTTVAGNHTVSLPQYDGLFTTQDVYLEDKTLNVMHNLKSGAYTFTSATGTFANRFVLRFGVGTTVAGKFAEQLSQGTVADAIMAFKQNQDLKINGGSSIIDSVKVYDLSGRMLTEQAGYNSNEVIFANPNWSSQVLIVQLTTTDKTIITKKVVF